MTDALYVRRLQAQQRYISRNKGTPGYDDSRREVNRRWRERHPEKQRAYDIVAYAVRIGKLVRPSVCERCGAEGRVQAHHHDYTEPLDVEWICSGCHGREHRHD